jgi:hypothetical protein
MTLAVATALEFAFAGRLESARRMARRAMPGLRVHNGTVAGERWMIGICAPVSILFGNIEKRY